MYLFFIKKNFCDGWDNMLSIIIPNLVVLGVILGFTSLMYVFQNAVPVVIALVFLMLIAISILTFAFGDSAVQIANFSTAHIADYFKAIPGSLKDGALFGLLIGAICTASYIAIPFYFAQKSLFGIFVGALFTWVVLFALLALQWFAAIRALMHNDFKKCLRKCFIIFFDNTGFSLFTAFYNLILFALSILMVGLMPSAAGIMLSQVNALRLRLYKYDYLEKHPELKTPKERRYIPWSDLLEDDKEALGPRSFKSFIFPWKE
ncbi:MAG TPA: hypothetical protein DCL73_04095 [Treponema sp.]|nr:hypothetical protein [Treponema sp.]